MFSDDDRELREGGRPGQAVTPGECSPGCESCKPTCGCVHDSPDFVPDAQRALAARGFERVNRHAPVMGWDERAAEFRPFPAPPAAAVEKPRDMTADEAEAYEQVLESLYSEQLVPETPRWLTGGGPRPDVCEPCEGRGHNGVAGTCVVCRGTGRSCAPAPPQPEAALPATDPACDWPDDAKHENGNYLRRCMHCGREFIGHRRRIECRACLKPQPPPPAPGADEMSREAYEVHLAGTGPAARRKLLAHDAALRTRASEAEEREAKWRRETSAACELSERAREIVVSALNQPPEHFYDRHDNGEWSAEHAAFAIRSLFRERDEAREQLSDREKLIEHLRAQSQDAIEKLRADLAAANARAEEAEKAVRLAVAGLDAGSIRAEDFNVSLVAMKGEVAQIANVIATERAARQKAEGEREAYKQDRDLTAHRLATAEAEERVVRALIGTRAGRTLSEAVSDAVTSLHERAEAAEAEVKRWKRLSAEGQDLSRRYLEESDALRARIARLVEIGDMMADPSSWSSLELARGRWRSARAAKADAPAKEQKTCRLCGGEGRIQQGTGTASPDGGEDWRVIDCPECSAPAAGGGR